MANIDDLNKASKAIKWLNMADSYNLSDVDSFAVVIRFKPNAAVQEPLQIEMLPGSNAFDAVAAKIDSFITAKRTTLNNLLTSLGITRTA